MKHPFLWIRSTLLGILLLATACQPIQPEAAQPATQTTDAQIQNAMSAAPPAVAKEATILAWPSAEGGDMVVLREGSNGWTCIADWPASPGNDPSCNDSVWTAWNDAYAKGEEPEITAPGIAYMLQGGSDPSNTDPMVMEPAPGEDWVNTPPHIMILAPGGFDAADFATEPKPDEPYIMWEGTPYAHLMVPVTPMAKDAMGAADDVMQNTLSSTPAGITMNATIMGYPAKEGDPMVVLKEGTNGWVCYPDRTVSPGNDPSCNNATMEAAFAAFTDAVVTKPGLSYMLQGGSDESNFDITATGPAPGEDWITTPPHVMLMVPGGFAAEQFTTDHTSGFPYIMFDDTSIEHLMIPVNTGEMDMENSGEHTQAVSLSNPQTESDQDVATKIDARMTQLNEEGTFNGVVLIAHNGQVILRKGYGLADREQNIPNIPTTRFRLASLTKQFTAMAILMLQEQGKLSVEDQACQYVTACPAEWQGMTIHHLLTHTAGVYDFRDFIYTGQTPPTPSTSAQVIERIKEPPLAFAPGKGWSYTNGGFMVAGYIVEQVSGQSYAQFLQEHIFDPLGMKNTGYVDDASALAVGYRNASATENPVDSSLPFAAAGLYSTVEDLYLYAQALDSGNLLSPPSLETFFKQHVQLGSDNGGFSPGYEPPVSYAYGWGVATFHGHRVIGHDGWIEGYGGDLRRYPDDNITTILLMNQSEPYAALLGDQIAEVLFATE